MYRLGFAVNEELEELFTKANQVQYLALMKLFTNRNLYTVFVLE